MEGIPEESCKCFSFMLESVIEMGKKHYPQTLLEECKYEIKKKKIENLTNDDFKSDNESDNEKSND